MTAKPRVLRRALAGAVLVLLGGLAASADVIHLEDGAIYRGTITRETQSEVTIQTKVGPITVKRRDIARIEKDQTVLGQYQERERGLRGNDDPEAHCRLGLWARENQLEEQAVKCFERAIALDSFHRGAREGLGHRYHQGRWYTADEYKRTVGGLVEWEGRWVTAEERARLEAGFVKDESGAWVRPEDLARAAEDQRLARERASEPATPATPGGAPASPRRPDAPPAADPARPAEDTAWYRDNTSSGGFDAAATVESRHYRVRTNAKPEYARRYGEMLDRYYGKFVRVFRDFMPAGNIPKSDVWIYASQQEFMAAEGMGQSVGGFYNTGTRRVTAFHGLFGMSGTTREVLAHEGTHQFQDIVLNNGFGNAPIWILEGLAVLFESAYDDGKEVVVGLVPRDRLAVLKRGLETNQLIPLVDLIRTQQSQFTAYHYAHAWGLIYMILYYGESKTVRARCLQWFADLFIAAKRGRVTPEMVEERLGGRDKLLELETTWRAWLKDLPYDYDPRASGD